MSSTKAKIVLCLGLIALALVGPTCQSIQLPTFADLDINDDFSIDSINIGGEDAAIGEADVGDLKSGQSNVIRAVVLLRGSKTNGVVRMEQHDSEPTLITGFVSGLYPFGRHGFHVHQHAVVGGDCESAGEHYNPTQQNHGSPDSLVSHIGDLGNLQADAQGLSRFEIRSAKITLRGKFSVIERALVVHLHTDDLGTGYNRESLNSGNSGARIACGTIKFVSIG